MPGRKKLAACLLAAALAAITGCSVKETRRLPPQQVLPLLNASLGELLERTRQQHEAIHAVNLRAELVPTTGSAYSGVIEEYRDVRAFLLATRTPLSEEAGGGTGLPVSARAAEAAYRIRVIGQAPVVRTNIFDMVADQDEFRIYIPPKNKFIVGPSRLERPSEKPIENLRPQHLLEALFVTAPDTRALHLLEEQEISGLRYYVVSELETAEGVQLRRKWWFRRTNLALARVQRFGAAGELLSDVHYDVWTQHGELRYPHWILLSRPPDDYRLELRLQNVELNPNLNPEQFQLVRPAGTELVEVKDEAGEKPAAQSRPEPEP